MVRGPSCTDCPGHSDPTTQPRSPVDTKSQLSSHRRNKQRVCLYCPLLVTSGNCPTVALRFFVLFISSTQARSSYLKACTYARTSQHCPLRPPTAPHPGRHTHTKVRLTRRRREAAVQGVSQQVGCHGLIVEVETFLLVVFVKLKLSLKTNIKQKQYDFFFIYKQSNIRRRFDAGVQLLTDAQRRLLVRVANNIISFI